MNLGKINNIVWLVFMFVLISIPHIVTAGGVMHQVGGTVTYSEGGSPANAYFSAYIKTRPGETLIETSPGCGYSSGYYWIQCASFPSSWDAGDVLHININDGAGRLTSSEVTLTYDDSNPLNLTIPPIPPVDITISTNPPGLGFTVDGSPFTGPHTFSWIPGSSKTIAVGSPQSGGAGTQYLYASWSDGGNQSHSYTVPGSNQIVTANLNTQYYLTVSSTHGSPTGEAWYNAGASASFGVTTPESGGVGTQYVFTSWSGSGSGSYTGSGASHSVTMNGPITETVSWKTQYYLTINSTYGSPTGQGWYDSGSSANFGVTTPASGGAGMQYVFTSWTGSGSGSYTGSTASTSVTMNNPITETTGWKIQYQLTVTSVRGTPSGTAWYDAGGTANLSVTPTTVSGGAGTQYLFTGWAGSGSGSYTGSDASSSLTMNNPITETASWKTQYYLTTSENPDAGGNMAPVPPGGWYDSGAVVGVDATVNSGYQFTGWTGGLSGSTKPNTITMSSAKSLTANFGILVTYTFNTDPTGRSYKVDGVSYNSEQLFVWGAGSTHTLGGQTTQSGGAGIQYVLYSILDNSGNEFLPSGSLPSETSVQFPVGVTDKSITGKFRTQYYLTVSSPNGSPTGQGWFNAGSTANFGVTTPVNGGAGTQYVFTSWTGSGSGSFTGSDASYSVIMNNPITETAGWKALYLLTLISSHGTTSGGGWYDAGTNTNFSVNPATAAGDAGTQYLFTGWTGSGSGSYTGPNPASSITINNPITETANWKTQYYLTTSENPDAGGNITPAPPGGWYDGGVVVNVDAMVSSGYIWAGWSGSLSGMTKPMTITLNSPKAVTANFANIQITITTNPAGRSIVVDGTSYTAPQTFTWLVNSSHSLSTGSPQNGGSGMQYLYTSWSDGGGQTHNYSVPGSNQTVTAIFKTQYYLNVNSSHGNPQGSGWYDAGGNGYFSVTSPETQGGNRYIFTNWSGDASGSSNPGSVIMNSAKNVYTNWKTQYYLAVISSHGNPQGSGWYESGATANFSVATPDFQNTIRYLFQNWSGDYNGTNSSSSIGMNVTKTVTANWSTQYYLTAYENPDVGGNMTPAPPGAWYDQGAQVECSAIADTDYVFGGWSGDPSGVQDSVISIVMDNPKSVTANFTLKGKVQITSNPPGLTVIIDGGSYVTPHNFSWVPGSSHSLGIFDTLQNGADGIRYVFQNWSDGRGKNHIVTVSDTTVYIANFKVQYYLTTASNPPEGGNVLPVPLGNWYDADTQIMLSAFARIENGYIFANWSGDLTNDTNPVTLVMSRPKSVTAVFKLQTYQLTTVVEPAAAGAIHCFPEKSSYVFGETVKMVIEVNEGYYHSCWDVDGIECPASDSLVVTMNKDRIVMAKFEVTAVDDKNMSGMPNDYRLFQSYPNPFNPQTTIVFQLSKTVSVTLDVYNSSGRRLRTLLNETKSTGKHQAVWDGKDDLGNMVGSGIYYYQIRTKDFHKVMKMIYIK